MYIRRPRQVLSNVKTIHIICYIISMVVTFLFHYVFVILFYILYIYYNTCSTIFHVFSLFYTSHTMAVYYCIDFFIILITMLFKVSNNNHNRSATISHDSHQIFCECYRKNGLENATISVVENQILMLCLINSLKILCIVNFLLSFVLYKNGSCNLCCFILS